MDSPDKEWRRLTENYAGMYDEELQELARDYKDLTEMAQQLLRDEIKRRGLEDPTAPRMPASQRVSEPASQRAAVRATAQDPSLRSGARMNGAPAQWASKRDIAARPAEDASPDPRAEVDRMRFTAHYATLGDDDLLHLAEDMESLTAGAQLALNQELERRNLVTMRATTETQDAEEEDALERAEERTTEEEETAGEEDDSDAPHDFSWKVPLGDYYTREEAWQRAEMLRRAGIERWYADQTGSRLLVAADQLEEAQRIVAHPVPADIVELSQTPVPEYEMPKCPRCHAADPVLIDTQPSNRWLCESCGNEWSDPVEVEAPR